MRKHGCLVSRRLDPDLIAYAFDLALMQTAARHDLSSKEGRSQTAAMLAGLFEALVVCIRPQVTLELGAHGPRRLHVLLVDDDPATIE